MNPRAPAGPALCSPAALQDCVATVAERLADPGRVVAVLDRGAPWIRLDADERRPRWNPRTLAGGPAGIALLFGELAEHDGGYRRVAHRHLAMAVDGAGPAAAGGLHTGMAGIAFAARTLARGPRDYAGLLDAVDRQITAWVAHALADARAERAAEGGTSFLAYDVISGLSGIGRYLLLRAEHGGDDDRALARVLEFLVELSRPGSGPRPGWWVHHPPSPGLPDTGGHVNFGLAHGLAGPLALLSTAWTAGHRVPGQHGAIARMASWYVEQQGGAQGNPFWPAALPGDDRLTPPSWCYGGSGIARALQLAGGALGERSWTDAASSAARTLAAWLRRPDLQMAESMLCHGWAGVLQAMGRIGRDLADPAQAPDLDDVAARVLGGYDPATAFGFRVHRMGEDRDIDLPGLLEGAAGIALAIHTHLSGRAPATGWDGCLLLV